MKADWGKAEARRIYARARPLYHPLSTNTLDPIVKGGTVRAEPRRPRLSTCRHEAR